MRSLLNNSSRATGCAALFALCVVAASPAAAQVVDEPNVAAPPAIDIRPPAIDVAARSVEGGHRSVFGEVFMRVVKDPTTYALPPIVYSIHRLDWDTSQQLFAHGYLEANPNFTLTGRVGDVPISHAAGNKRILRYSASMIGRSALNNGICALIERRLIDKNPQHRKLIRTLGWIERGFATAYWSYRLTHNQYGQWRENQRMLAGLQSAPAALPTAVP